VQTSSVSTLLLLLLDHKFPDAAAAAAATQTFTFTPPLSVNFANAKYSSALILK